MIYREEDNELTSKVLTLTRSEVLFLDDAFSFMLNSEHRATSSKFPVPVTLVVRLGLAVLQSEDTGTVAIEFVDNELWMLRECCVSTDVYSGDNVGITLRKKIYGALLRKYLDQQLVFEHLVSGIGPF